MKRHALVKVLGLFLLIGTMVAGASAQQDIDPRVLAYADIVLYNGKILTADDDFTIVQAVAVRDGKFLARGTTAGILPLAGPNTRRIDLQGKSVIPGLIESHDHPTPGSPLKTATHGFVVFDTLASGFQQIRQKLEGVPPGEYRQFQTYRNRISNNVTRGELDKVAPQNPLILSFSTYEFNMNSPALKMLFDYLGTEDFPGVLKDPQTGEPNGKIRGLASGVFGYEVLPWPEPEEMEEMARRHLGSRNYPQRGITTRIGRAPGVSITIFRHLWATGQLTHRIRISHEFLRDNPEPEKFLKRIGNLTGLGDDWFKIIGTMTQQPDGGMAAGAALMSQPKLRPGPMDNYGPFGQNRWADDDASNAPESMVLAARYGWKIGSVHSYGDESTMEFLRAAEKASQVQPFLDDGRVLPGGPWVIDHNSVSSEEGLALMKRLNVIPSVDGRGIPGRVRVAEDGLEGADGIVRGQGGFTPAMGNAWIYMYGADRLNSSWSWARSFIDAGIKPVIEADGLEGIQTFITRKDRDGRVWAPQERVSRSEALWMKTRWVAYISGDEDKLGSIEDGKLADFVVLGGDYMTVPEDEIENLPILMTVVGGKVMYEQN